MSERIEIHLRDIGRSLVDAWESAFEGVESVRVSCGDIFSTKVGQVGPSDPIDVTADAIVSPANSFGFMDGGIDAVYTYQFGGVVQQRVQAAIVAQFGGEMPVGAAVIVPTGNREIPWCISAPTMRVPMDVSGTANAYLAFRAALRAVVAHNASGERRIASVLCPGLATAVGKMPVGRCARQMRVAWDRVLGAQRGWMPRSVGAALADEIELVR